MALQSFNYHTHTYLCGHATGTAEDMILAAIKAGFKKIGISEHMGYADWDDPTDRINYAELDDYLAYVYTLKEKYKDQIEVYVGFECEFFDDCIDHLRLYKEKCDFMICGQHCPDRKSKDYFVAPYNSDAYIELMAEQICAGIELGFFKYIAHPDYFMLNQKEYTPRKKAAVLKVLQCAKKHDVVIEINLKGTKYGVEEYDFGKSYYYPNHETYRMAGEVGVKVCFGYDAHSPEDLLYRRHLEAEVKEAFKSYQLNFIDDLTL